MRRKLPHGESIRRCRDRLEGGLGRRRGREIRQGGARIGFSKGRHDENRRQLARLVLVAHKLGDHLALEGPEINGHFPDEIRDKGQTLAFWFQYWSLSR